MQIINLATTSISQILKTATQILANGGLIIYPTETVYGAGVDAANQQAVDKLLAYKSRREGKPLSIAVTDKKMAGKFVKINDQASHIYQRFLPGPFTVISQVKKPSLLADGVASEFNTLGIRIPDYPLIQALVKAYQKPITATSANASGKKRPYAVADILNNLSNKQKKLIDLIIDAGQLPPNKPSTIIDTSLSTPITIRQGDKQLNLAKSKNQLTKNSSDKTAFNNFFKLENEYSLTSNSETETQEIAGKILLKYWDQIKKTGLVIGLNGPLGAGKTIFAKGAAKFLKIAGILRSPTYNYWFDYNYQRYQTIGKLIHADVWKVDNAKLLNELQLIKQLATNNILIIEWFSQIHSFITPKIKTPIITVDLKLKNSQNTNERQLFIKEFSPK